MWYVNLHISFVCILNVSTSLWNLCIHQDTSSKKHFFFYKCKISKVKEYPNMNNVLLLVLKMWRASLTCTYANPNKQMCVRKVRVRFLQLSSISIHVTHLPHKSNPLNVCKHRYYTMNIQTNTTQWIYYSLLLNTIHWIYKPIILP